MIELNRRIRHKILSLYKTPEEFSDKSGISYEKIAEIFNGDIGNLNWEDILKICGELQITVDFCLNDNYNKFNMLAGLDNKGIQKVYSTAVSEHNRLLKEQNSDT